MEIFKHEGVRDIVLRVVSHISKCENFQVEESEKKNNPSVRIQMYEFFFSNILIEAMAVPFQENSYMLGFFERQVRKRDTFGRKSRRQVMTKQDRKYIHEDQRRDRTVKLRTFYEFFSLLYDEKMYTPFS